MIRSAFGHEETRSVTDPVMSAIAHGIKCLGVLGAGQMGTGIALVSSLRAKVPVLLHDTSKDQVAKGLSLMDAVLSKDVAKGRIQSTEAKEARDLVRVVDSLEEMREADMVIEAVSENLDLKRTVFRGLAETLRPDTMLATNTSSISITKIAASVVPPNVSASSEAGKASAGRVVGKDVRRRVVGNGGITRFAI